MKYMKSEVYNMRKWRCNACGYVDRKDEVPRICPLCQMGSEVFEEIIKEERKPRERKNNTDDNRDH